MLNNCKTAIILAGGKSSRMGFDKIDIPYKDGNLLDYQVKELKKIFSEIILVSNKLTHYHDDSVIVVTDEFKEIGPLAGMHVGLKHASSAYCYVIACDMPFINIEYIKIMDALLINSNKEVLVSEIKRFIEPFNAIYHRSLYKKIEAFASSGEIYSLKDLINQSNYQIIDRKIVNLFNKNMFYNLNTVEDIKKYLENEVVTSGKNNR